MGRVMDANTTPTPPSVPAPGIQAMSNYRTTFLDVDESAVWLPAVREAAGAMYPANASMARALAGDLSELIAITDPEAGTTISSLVSDRRISMLASHRRARGMSPKGVDRTISTLKALQRALCGVGAPVAAQPKIVRERFQLDVLTQVAACDDPWLAQQASCLLQALEFGHWDRPLPHEDFRQFIKRAGAAGFTGSGWRWRDMKTERLRRAFEQPTPVVEVMHRLNVSARQMSSIADALVPDGSDPSSVRGCGTLSRPSTTWRIVSNSTGTMQPSRGARTSPHRSSKAAARRLAEQIRHRNTADPVPLDPDLEQILAT